MLRDRDTFFWSLFTDHFGSNPNTPYMWLALPAFGFFLPSPMWHMKRQDAVLLIARRPPEVDYFSFTSFALWVPRRGLQFSSLGDSVNNLNLKQTEDGVFAHVLTASRSTFKVVQQALIDSGLPASAINLRVIPSDIGALFDDWTHFETVLRLFRFENQSEGDAYLRSHYPVFYIKGQSGGELFPTEAYKERKHPDSKHERDLEAEFDSYNQKMLKEVGEQLELNVEDVQPVKFDPLMIQGLECLKHDTQCLGDCPDAAYYGPYIREDSDVIDMLTLEDDEVHLVGLVNHRYWNVSVYGSLAALRSASSKHSTLSKTRMNIRATPLGVTSFDFEASPFASWAFTRSTELCDQLSTPIGCTVVEERHVASNGFLTYCERIYLNPTTGTGPHWDDLLPARLFQLKRRRKSPTETAVVGGLPEAIPVQVFNQSVPMHFTHIVKTGGESLELHLAPQPAPRLDYSACRKAAVRFQGPAAENVSYGCATAARSVSIALCGLNCECCAKDVRKISGGFHGTLIRSPRAHTLSIFSQCHVAHQNSWQRIVEDLPQYLAEGILRGTERACGSYCTTFESQWEADLRGVISQKRPEELQVIPFLHNMQSHTLTCSTAEHSLGQHFRLKEEPREPSFAEANASLHSFDWIGLTDLFEHSVCLLHYQANGSLPARCDCDGDAFLALPRFTHGVLRRDAGKLPEDLLQKIDNFTAVDAQLFASALRLLLGRLRYVEQVTQRSLLRCVRWRRLWQTTRYIPNLWAGPSQLLPS